MKLYLAGPMTGYPDSNYPAFHRVAAQMRRSGHVVLCPAESFGGRSDLDLCEYARYDIHLLLQVDGVVLLPDWECSDGAKREVVIASWLGLPFFSWVPVHTGLESWLVPIYPDVLLRPRSLP